MYLPQYVTGIHLEKTLPEDSYFAKLPVVQNLQKQGSLEFTEDITFLVGENSTGKSTLLEGIAIALGFNPEGETKNFCFSTEDTHASLYQYLRVPRRQHFQDGFFLRAESFYNVATNIDQMDREPSFAPKVIQSYGGVSLHRQSHGESFLALIQNRFGGNGLYLLDEPEAALSPDNLLVLMRQIHLLLQKKSQFIIATHSPMLLTFPGAQVIELTEDAIQTKDYRETRHYQLVKAFLEQPETYFHHLFSDL